MKCKSTLQYYNMNIYYNAICTMYNIIYIQYTYYDDYNKYLLQYVNCVIEYLDLNHYVLGIPVWNNTFALSWSVMFSIAVNVFTSEERKQDQSMSLSTLKDIKEAYFRGDYYPTHVENSVFDLDSIHRFQIGFLMTTGFTR